MSASEHLNPDQHEPRPKRTKTWSSVRKEKPSIRDAQLRAITKKKQEERSKEYSDRASAAHKRATEWYESKKTLDRNITRPYDRSINPVGFIAPAMFTDEDFKNEGPSEGS